MKAETILVENVISAGSRRPVNREKYEAARDAVMAVLPASEPGLSLCRVEGGRAAASARGLVPGWPDRRLVAEVRSTRP